MSAPATCPAALPLAGAAGAPSVLCGELHLANDGAHVEGFADRGHVSPVISGDRDPASIATYCHGQGVPGSRCSYIQCPIWRAAREADWARRKGPDALRDAEAQHAPAIDPELREYVNLTVGG